MHTRTRTAGLLNGNLAREMTKAERAGTRDERMFRTDMYGTQTTAFAMFLHKRTVQCSTLQTVMFLSRENRVLSPTPGRM